MNTSSGVLQGMNTPLLATEGTAIAVPFFLKKNSMFPKIIIWISCLAVIALFVIFDLLHHDYKDALINIGIFIGVFVISRVVRNYQERKQK